MTHLGPLHPVASVAGRYCEAHMGRLRHGLIGGTACGACWERAIRNDERVVVQFDLPREVTPDPSFIDEIAVELACAGEKVALTFAERAEVIRRLSVRREPIVQIADRLRVDPREVARVRANKDWRVAS